MNKTTFAVGQQVEKVGGDYTFSGHVVAVFNKLSGEQVRYVVENGDGILHIFSARNLTAVKDDDDAKKKED
jgi:hypothetical protein